MIGPPGLPKIGRRISHLFEAPRAPSRLGAAIAKWGGGLYLAGVLAHFGHHMAFEMTAGTDPSLIETLISAPISLVWPADLIGTLMQLS